MILGLRTLATADRLGSWLQVLLDLGQRLLVASSTERVCDEAIGMLFEFLATERVVILLDDSGSRGLTPRAVRAAPGLAQADLGHVRKLADYALQKSATVLFPEADASDADKSWVPALAQPIHSSMVAPLTSSLRIHGAVYVDRVTTAPFTPEELELFAAFANQTACALRAVSLRNRASVKDAFEHGSVGSSRPRSRAAQPMGTRGCSPRSNATPRAYAFEPADGPPAPRLYPSAESSRSSARCSWR
jgi:transcriptional regulator with GAF, ATPase, and Fis domain